MNELGTRLEILTPKGYGKLVRVYSVGTGERHFVYDDTGIIDLENMEGYRRRGSEVIIMEETQTLRNIFETFRGERVTDHDVARHIIESVNYLLRQKDNMNGFRIENYSMSANSYGNDLEQFDLSLCRYEFVSYTRN